MTTARPFEEPDDLRAMQSLVGRIWHVGSRWHIGDLAWQCGGRAITEPTMLWESGADVVAWGWIRDGDQLDLVVDPAHPEVVEDVLTWFEGATGEARTVVVEDEPYLTGPIGRRGYRADDEAPFDLITRRSLDQLPQPRLPAGFVSRPIGSDDIERRVDVHRRSWSLLPFADGDVSVQPELTTDIYRRLMSTWPYRPELDWVVEASDGSFVACCCLWLDEDNRVAEMEPVGTDPTYRRLGLSTAVCLSALDAAAALGAREAIVSPRGDDRYPVPRGVYGRMGFDPVARTRTYRS